MSVKPSWIKKWWSNWRYQMLIDERVECESRILDAEEGAYRYREALERMSALKPTQGGWAIRIASEALNPSAKS